MKSGENINRGRRNFLKTAGLVLLSIPILNACKNFAIKWSLKLSGTGHILGHRLLIKDFPKPTETIEIPLLIIGSGISGLSAARYLHKNNFDKFLLVELENRIGGNSSHGQNKYSKYPLGAHYLPLPNLEDKELLEFLEENKIITGYRDEKPLFDEVQLCFAPHERLFFKAEWHEGLVPKNNISKNTQNELEKFSLLMEYYKSLKGTDKKYVFNIPLDNSSADKDFMQLDKITMKEWVLDKGFNSEELFNYIDYCCRDDYGLGIEYVSAWAGIHYFAARKNDYEQSDTVLTWPEGNSRLTKHLKKYTKGKEIKNHLAYQISVNGDKTETLVFDDVEKKSKLIVSDKVLLATPQFINQHLIQERRSLSKKFHYVPWLLATLTVTELSQASGTPLSWDNVIYKSKGLGYIYDQHQGLSQFNDKKVITYYCSFSGSDLKKERKKLFSNNKIYWEKWVLEDLKMAHPNIENFIESIEIYRIGHGMISPVPGFISGGLRKSAAETLENKIYFAHSDLSGISIFEEAFHQGITAAKKILNATTLDT